jgi:transcriptional regulator with XRE-family HTH domain
MDDLGLRLRHIRELNGLSQRALARASGVSNATISLIEHNRTNPSLGMLKKILDSVPISVADFFALEMTSDSKIPARC